MSSDGEILKLKIEKDLWNRGIKYVIGVDESGRGCIAGPVVSAAVCLREGYTVLNDVYDSKAVSEKNREKVHQATIDDTSVVTAWDRLSHEVIDEINILQAAMKSMSNAIEGVQTKLRSDQPTNIIVDSDFYAVVDGNKTPKLTIKSKPIVKGDSLCYSIALASIIAKVERDKIMLAYHEAWPQYGFNKHKGYPTNDHVLAIHRYGPCPIHRMTFKPLKGRAIGQGIILPSVDSL